jgi:hypothetical protein
MYITNDHLSTNIKAREFAHDLPVHAEQVLAHDLADGCLGMVEAAERSDDSGGCAVFRRRVKQFRDPRQVMIVMLGGEEGNIDQSHGRAQARMTRRA